MFSQKHKQGWRNPWALGLVAVVLAGVLINARMLWNVIHHPARLLDENYSVKNHDKHDAKWVQQQAERSTLGWQATIHSPQQLQNDSMASEATARFILIGNPAQLALDLKDHEGNPVQGGQIQIAAQWPGDPSFDFNSTLNESSAGHYAGELKFPRAGSWDLIIKAKQNEREFEMEQKIFTAFEKVAAEK